MKDTQGNIITEEEFTKDIGHGVLLPDMTTQNKTMEERFEDMFEWTDFGGDIGGFILKVKEDRYDTEDTLRDKLKSFIQTEIALAIDNRNREVVEIMAREADKRVKEHYKMCTENDFINGRFWEAKHFQQFLSALTSHKRD